MKQRMRSNVFGLFFAGALILTGCSSTQAASVTSTAPASFSPADALQIEQIDWHVDEAVDKEKRYLSFNYTNNSAYTILDVELKFKQKKGLTDEQYALFDDVKAKNKYLIEDNTTLHLKGYNRKVADPGETVTASPVVINGASYPVENMEQYALFEPDIMTIAFLGSDGKGYGVYYDYKNQKFSASSQGAQDLHVWSDSDLVKTLPDPDFTADTVSTDEEGDFFAEVFGVSPEGFDEYIKAVQEKGYTEDKRQYDDGYFASNSDGVKLILYYNAVEEQMNIHLENKAQ